MAKARKKIVSSASVENNIASAVEKLSAASGDSEKAVAERSRTGKKLTAELRRLRKRRAMLMKRKKTAASKAKEWPSGETRSALRTVEKDVATTTRDLAKARAAKAVNTPELAALKAAQRQSNAYMKAVDQADKVLNKPKKRRKRARKKAATKS
jgi:hypothetical protein